MKMLVVEHNCDNSRLLQIKLAKTGMKQFQPGFTSGKHTLRRGDQIRLQGRC